MTTDKPASRSLVAALAMIIALAPLSMDMYLPAVPAMGKALGTSIANVQLTIAIFMLGMGTGQVLFGPLSDRLGRRGPVLASITLFIGSVIACAYAANVGWLIGLRFLQGLGVTGAQVVVYAVLADLYGARELARLNSLLAMVMSIAPMLAPLIGGFLLLAFDWRAIFLVLAAYGALVWIVAWVWLPETRDPAARARSKSESPLGSYLAVLRNRPLMRLAAGCAFGASAFFTYLVNSPRLFIEDFGISPQRFGWYFGANVIGLIIANQINRVMLKRYSPEWMLRRATVVSVAAATLFVLASVLSTRNHWPIIVALFLLISSFPLLFSNAMALAQSQDRSRSGSVAAVIGAGNWIVGAAAAIVSGALHNGTPVPMALTMLSCVSVALLLLRPATAKLNPGL